MRYGIPLIGNRVAPRCTYADSVLLVVSRRNRVMTEDNISFSSRSLFDLIELLSEYRVDTLICGGISRESKDFLQSRNVEIIDNVASTIDEIIDALRKGALYSGFGLSKLREYDLPETAEDRQDKRSPKPDTPSDIEKDSRADNQIDCISCSDRVCLRGDSCPVFSGLYTSSSVKDKEVARILEATQDIACEEERTLCRLSELIYFCLEMGYKRLGIAYCTDLQEPTEVLTQVLRRFFEVFPVCCKVGGVSVDDSSYRENTESVRGDRRKLIACNPLGQAEILNRLGTDLNVIVGICMGADCIFARASEAPVTTLFVKDKSLANNPIGALYSDYYLGEAANASALKR